VELTITVVVCALVFAAILFVLGRRYSHPIAADELLQRVRRSGEGAEVEVTRKGKPQENKLGRALLGRFDLLKKLEQYMWQAGLYWRVSEIVLGELLIFLGGFIAGWVLWSDPMLAGGLGGGLATLPFLYIGFRRKRRIKAFARQLPFALDLIKSTLEAGHTLQRAFFVVVGEFSDPIASEMRTVLEQARLGVPLVRALDDLYTRVPEDDLRLMVTAIKMQTEVGTSLAQIIGRLSEVVRTRQRLHAQVRALTAQARMSGTLVGLMPVALLAIFSLIKPDYPRMLFTDPGGIVLLKAAIALDVVAVVVIRKVIRVSY
jgi:tight adherence protein B